MNGPVWNDEDAIAWTATPYHVPVLDADEQKMGTAESLLGDENADIFHGLAVKLEHGGHLVEVPADHVKKITLQAVHTDVRPDQVASLPAYSEEKWFHLGWGGLFRKHPDWEKG